MFCAFWPSCGIIAHMNKPIREVSEPVRKLYQSFLLAAKRAEAPPGDNPIAINEVVGQMASVYERLRNLMNDADEHLFRKNAIRRYLARKDFFSAKSLRELAQLSAVGREDYERWARALICELIRAKYLPNNSIPEDKVTEVAWIIEKNIITRDQLYRHVPKRARKGSGDLTLELAASEIEEALAPNNSLMSTVGSMYELLRHRTAVRSKTITPEEKDIQLYIAILKSVLRGDKGVLRYHLFLLYFPDWKTCSRDDLAGIIVKFVPTLHIIDQSIQSEINMRLAAKVKPYAVCYGVLRDFSQEKPGSAYHDIQIAASLKQQVTKTLDGRYKKIRTRLVRSAWRSVIYIFVTKMVVAVFLELPYDKYVVGEVNLFALGVNILFPPLLMFLLTVTVRIPAKRNTEAILERLGQIIFKDANQSIEIIVRPRVRLGFFLRNAFRFLYLCVYALILWFVISVLIGLDFNAVNISIFLFFLFLISFFAMRIRNSVKEIIVLKRRENVFTFFLDIVGIPIIRAGRWMNYHLSRINIFVFIMDFIIEAPFKVFLEVVEGWVGYLREKREEVY